MFSLDGRLSVCASLVRQDARLADVGTDHAYLPVWLAKNGRIKSAVACDIRKKPLRSGHENIMRYGVGETVEARLSDGLDEISPEEASDIVIAGMGGELICKIIDRAQWLKDSDKRLILQPMTKAHILRKYLCKNGFDIISETPCTHAGKYYAVICAEYTGKPQVHDDDFFFTGRLDKNEPLSREYAKMILSKLYKMRLDGSGMYDEAIEGIKKKYGVDFDDNC